MNLTIQYITVQDENSISSSSFNSRLNLGHQESVAIGLYLHSSVYCSQRCVDFCSFFLNRSSLVYFWSTFLPSRFQYIFQWCFVFLIITNPQPFRFRDFVRYLWLVSYFPESFICHRPAYVQYVTHIYLRSTVTFYLFILLLAKFHTNRTKRILYCY